MLRPFASVSFALVLLVAGPVGCATKFVAKRVDPLKPERTPGWDAGEVSEASRAYLRRDWERQPAAAIAELQGGAGKNPAVRRAIVEVALREGMRLDGKFLTNRGAAGYYLCAAENAFDGRGQGGAEMARFWRDASRYAVARLAGLRELAVSKNVALAPQVAGPARSYAISLRTRVPEAVELGQFSSVLPADRFKIVGGRDLALVEGTGTPLVAKVRVPPRRVKRFEPPDDLWMPLTATVEFGPAGESPRKAIFTVYDRKNIETVKMSGRTEPLAADFSMPFAVRTRELNRENFFTLGILGFLRGDRYFDRAGLYPVEFPRTDKLPVVFVHGLISDPNDWRFLHNALLADPTIRQKYQFWAFYYPTSMAVPWSATILRRDLANARRQMNPTGKNAKLNDMTLIGHSMGGLLSRMQIVQGGERCYDQYFTKPVDKLRLSKAERQQIHDMFFFSPNPDVKEVIFICVPHQGSFLATNWIGKIGRIIARLPLSVVQTSLNIVTLNGDALAAGFEIKPNTSIDSLSPGGKFVTLLGSLPMDPKVKKYSIIGNRGKPGDIWQSSDGVVPYWSSHIEGVPETIIPSTHSGPEHEACATAVKGLLLQPRP